jgi:uncharacterized protein with LGFP repeats
MFMNHLKVISLGLTSILATAALTPIVATTTSQPVYASLHGYAIYGAIFDKWAQLGGERSLLGNPTSSEQPVARGGPGRFNSFQNGFIYWHPKIGAYAVSGKIAELWNQLGRDRGLGFPITDQLNADNGGLYNDFERNASIYWHPSTGAHPVYGDIRLKWVSMGREKSRLGYPISSELPEGNAGQRVGHFQGGSIYWNSASRATIVTYK